ncbi:M23 family metallopeptidase [Tessaracoccus sp. MC1679]|uniref:M23 family metallopeptidase n=1 Tax=Tessaracoccus sp. MC1679 TaxID=2760313 RepID=UPI001603C71B|nr:M23 family metallopeptidase [Tessaracoccus sp. MC1679]
MNDATPVRNPRRAAEIDEIVEIDAHPARRSTPALPFAVSRRIVALGVAGALSVSALFAFAFTARDGGDTASESLDAAVPAAAASAAAMGFADRSQEVSRTAVRANLTEAVADEAAKERDETLDASVESAAQTEWMTNSTERQRLMDEDMTLVAAQSAKLKKEAEEAAKRLEEAKKAAAAAAAGKENLSSQDVTNLTTKGGSMPVKSNYRIGAGFGATGSWSRYHTGQDFPAPVGTPIYAAASGVVLSPTAGGWAGINVVIQHSNGGSTLYAHMSRKVVGAGETVRPGQLIGYVGNTGRSFGAHLHFEYYKPGVTPGDVYSASNPMTFLRSLGVG